MTLRAPPAHRLGDYVNLIHLDMYRGRGGVVTGALNDRYFRVALSGDVHNSIIVRNANLRLGIPPEW
jgi:hypothetical protein